VKHGWVKINSIGDTDKQIPIRIKTVTLWYGNKQKIFARITQHCVDNELIYFEIEFFVKRERGVLLILNNKQKVFWKLI
jgi:hypothetical protein